MSVRAHSRSSSGSGIARVASSGGCSHHLGRSQPPTLQRHPLVQVRPPELVSQRPSPAAHVAAAALLRLSSHLTVATPSGGLHLYFTVPARLDVPSVAGIWPGVDTRGPGLRLGVLGDSLSRSVMLRLFTASLFHISSRWV
jgi:hypothetical protein